MEDTRVADRGVLYATFFVGESLVININSAAAAAEGHIFRDVAIDGSTRFIKTRAIDCLSRLCWRRQAEHAFAHHDLPVVHFPPSSVSHIPGAFLVVAWYFTALNDSYHPSRSLHLVRRRLIRSQDVLDYKRAVPFTMFTGGVGRHAQGKLPISKDYVGDPSAKTVRHHDERVRAAVANLSVRFGLCRLAHLRANT